ncbi:MAG: sialidase family protein [Ginsengibacter sp.]
MRQIYTNSLLGLLIALISYGCAENLNPKKSAHTNIEAVTSAPVIPVLKRMESNAVLRIRVFIPPNTSAKNYQSIQATVNASSLNSLKELQIYSNGSEPLFNTRHQTGVLKPTSENFEIPINVDMKPGLNYIWIGATLKDDVSLDTDFTLQAVSLKDKEGNTLSINKDQSNHSKRTGIAIRKINDDGVNSYRIPGIVTTDKGTLLSVYDIRYKNSADLPGDIDVGLSRSTDGGNTWEPMKVIMDMGEPHENNGVGDPSILFDPITKKIWVAALWSKGNRSIAGSLPGLSPDTTGQFVLVSSDDDGLTWSKPYSITSQIKNPKWHLYFNGPGNGIVMQDGTLVFPSQYWDESRKPGVPHSSVIYSKDNGASWHSGIGAKYNTTEAQVVETTPNTLMLNMRDNRGKFRSVATTTDLGKTWTEHPTSYKDLIDPVCMASIIKARVNVNGSMKDVLFFSNPHTKSGRYNMTIQASLDMGETWLPAHQLLYDERDCFGYSALTKIDDHTIGVLYEGFRDLYFMRIPVSDIIK